MPTVLVSALLSVATRVGANRIVQGCRFHHPLGDPSRTIDGERAWRLRLVKTALQALQTQVTEPTVFEGQG